MHKYCTMVIANSESNTTLVSLCDNNNKHGISEKSIVVGDSGLLEYVQFSRSTTTTTSTTACHIDGGVATELLIPAPGSSNSIEQYVPLYLPAAQEVRSVSQQRNRHHPLDVDDYLSRNYYSYACDDNNSDNHKNATKREVQTGATALQESRKRLLSTKRRRLGGARERNRVLYVEQGERANSTSKEYDVLMSDKATTCHIVAFRSTTNSSDNSTYAEDDVPLTSLTHLDSPNYEECVREMIQEHIDHHHHRWNRSFDRSDRKRTKFVQEEKKCDDCCEQPSEERNERRTTNNNSHETVTIDIHVMGGFDDDDASSSSITDWLLPLLARLAKEFKNQTVGVRMVVKTLVVSSSNNVVDDRNNNSPIGRGLGIDARTGEVFLARCDDEDDNNGRSSGPVSLLRSVRLWSRAAGSCGSNHHAASSHLQPHKLSVVHTAKDVDDLFSSWNVGADDSIRSEYSLFWVQPFLLRLIPDVDVLLGLPNELLLQYTSTSPEVEYPGFVKDVRASLQFLKQQCDIERDDGKNLFGTNFDRPLVFGISQRGEWKRLSL